VTAVAPEGGAAKVSAPDKMPYSSMRRTGPRAAMAHPQVDGRMLHKQLPGAKQERRSIAGVIIRWGTASDHGHVKPRGLPRTDCAHPTPRSNA
jgi:hypothetical protein